MLLKVNDVAEEMGYSISTVYQLIYSGEIPVIQRKKGGAIRVSREDLDKFKKDNYSGTSSSN